MEGVQSPVGLHLVAGRRLGGNPPEVDTDSLRADDGQMPQAALGTCLVGCSLDSILHYSGPPATVVHTTSRVAVHVQPRLCLVQCQLLRSLLRPAMASSTAPYRRLFREYVRSVCVYGLTYVVFLKLLAL